MALLGVCAGLVQEKRGRLVHERRSGHALGPTGRSNGRQTASGWSSYHSALGRTQFTSREYQAFLRDHNLISSMSAVGSCADNAAAEGFFGMLKRERVNRRNYRTRDEARSEFFDYIERIYNPTRSRHGSTLKGVKYY